jgi:hypothetical protein
VLKKDEKKKKVHEKEFSSLLLFFFLYRCIKTDQTNDHEKIFSKTLKENKQSNMPSGSSMISVDNGQSLSDLFHKFIRMTVKTDDRDGRFKKRHSLSKSQQQLAYIPPSSKRSQRLVAQPTSRLPPRQQKRISTVAYYNVSPITTENNSYTHIGVDEQDNYYANQVRSISFFSFLNKISLNMPLELKRKETENNIFTEKSITPKDVQYIVIRHKNRKRTFLVN